MYCNNCGEKLPDNVKFCSKCGVEIKNDSTSKGKRFFSSKDKKIKFVFILMLGIICILVGTLGVLLKDKEVDNNNVQEELPLQQTEYFSEEEYDIYKNLAEEISQIEKRYTDDNGYVKEEYIDDLWKLVQEQVEKEKGRGTIQKCTYDDEHKLIYIKFSSGIQYMYIPYIEGSMSAGEENRIITLEPDATNYEFLISAFMTWIDKEYNNLEYSGSYSVPASAQLIADSNGSYSYDKKSSYVINNNVTVERVKTLADYKVVIWEGHGGYISDVHSALITSDLDSSYAESYKYAEDLKDGSLIFAGTGILQKYAITSKFIEKYLGEMDDSLVFLGGCFTAKDRILADSFLSKGALAVVGYSDSVSIEYAMLTRANFFYSLSLNGITLDSAEKAMEYAWTHIGLNDPWKKEGAEMRLFFNAEDEQEDENITENSVDKIIENENPTSTSDVVIGQEIYEGEYVELTGNLIKRGDGNLIVKFETPVLFHGNVSSYIIEDVGLTGTNNSVRLEDILNKKVSIYGMAMEAHTIHHYDDVMIVDGYPNLKVLEGTQVQRINYYSSNGDCTSYVLPEYDKDVEIGGQEYSADGQKRNSYTYEYDEDGKCIKEVRYDPYGGKQLYFENEYDSTKRKIKSTIYNCHSGDKTHWIEYEYDSKGNCLNETWYEISGKVSQRIEKIYDDDTIRDEQNTNSLEVDVEDTVSQIRNWYSETQSNIGSLPCRIINDVIKGYFDEDRNFVKIVATKGYDNLDFVREYYFHEGELYFAFVYDGVDEQRLYFKDGQLIRYIDNNGNVFDTNDAISFMQFAEELKIDMEELKIELAD